MPLFTQPRRRGILRTSSLRSSTKLLLLDCVFMGCYSYYNVSTNVGAYTMSQDRCDLICIDAPRAETLRERLLDEDTALEAAERAKALSDPTRLTLAEALSEGGELCVCDLSWIVVRSRKDGKMVMYTLTEVGASLLSAVLGDTAAELSV